MNAMFLFKKGAKKADLIDRSAIQLKSGFEPVSSWQLALESQVKQTNYSFFVSLMNFKKLELTQLPKMPG